MAAQLLADRPAEEIAKLIQEIPSDDAAALVDYLPEELSSAVLELMRPKESGQVENLLEYAEKTAGRIMNPNVFALSEDLTVGEGDHRAAVVARRRDGVLSLRRRRAPAPRRRRLAAPPAAGRARDAAQADHDAGRDQRPRRHGPGGSGAAGRVVQPAGDSGRRRGEQAGRRHHRRRRHRRHQGRGDRGHLPARRRDRRRARLDAAGGIADQAAAVAGGEPGDGVPGRVGRQPVRAHDRSGGGAGGVHADRRRHGRQRRDPDPDRDRARHRARRADLGATPGRRCSRKRWSGWATAWRWASLGGHRRVADEGQPGAGRRAGAGDGHQHVHRGHCRDADSARPAGAEGGSGAGPLGVHHDVHRRVRLRLVPRPGDGVPEVSGGTG